MERVGFFLAMSHYSTLCQLFEVNFFSVVQLVQLSLPHFARPKGPFLGVIWSSHKTLPELGCLRSVSQDGSFVSSSYSLYSSKAALNHLATTLSVEELDITTISLRPGVVDTEMQTEVRNFGKIMYTRHNRFTSIPSTDESVLGGDDYRKFKDLHESGKLLPPDEPGHVIASLCANPPKDLSGQFLSWDDPILESHRLK